MQLSSGLNGSFFQSDSLGKMLFASNTGPSTHTLFIASPSGVCTFTVQPAQPPIAQAINSSRDSLQSTL
uniref:Uncharacterized protein n=1 Tax=uncultured gamma proteobacterium EB080_L93H08 TaxID=710973 RepID=E0Y2U2_9GAMM|nr:hypothetical protein [uncultured gamma proteobacterium EB080_L93H08]